MPAYAVVLTSPGPNKVSLIKEIRELTGLDLSSAKQLTDRPNSVVVRDLDRAEAERIADSLTRVGAVLAIVDESSQGATTGGRQGLILVSSGSRPSDVTRVLREQLGLGMKEAHDAIQRVPAVLLENAPEDEVARVARAIEAAGGVVEVSHP